DLRARGDLSLHILHIQRAIIWVDIDPAHKTSTVLSDQEPGSNIGIMIQTRYNQFVTRLEETCKATAHVQREAGHVLTKNNLFRSHCIKEISHCLSCLRDHSIGFTARVKCP